MKRTLLLLLIVFLPLWPVTASVLNADNCYIQFDLNIPGVREEMLNADFWLNNLSDADQILMSPAEIARYNRLSLRECEILKDLRSFPVVFDGLKLKSLIEKVSIRPTKKRYIAGVELDESYFKKLEDNLNIPAIKRLNPVRFGITVKRTEMRAFPAADRVFSDPECFETDTFIETALYPVEPLAILHQSLDGEWLLAQTYNYLAWVPANTIAFMEKQKLFNYLDAENSLVVTGKGVLTGYNPLKPEISELQLDMGTRVPLAKRNEIPMDIDGQHPAGNYVIKLPARNSEGNAEFRLGLIARSEDVKVGFLPLTRRNIISQAFKFLGQRYGWGGMFNTRDCSAFIMDVYRSMGVMLPRNAGEQGKMAIGITHGFTSEMPVEERKAEFDRMPSGTPIYMSGHAMLYLGKSDNDYYIIHDFAGFRIPDESGKLVNSTARCVFVTPLLKTFLSSGKMYIEGIYAGREFVIPKQRNQGIKK